MELKMEVLESQEVCGIVMPISAIDGCSEAHWGDVLEIISDAITCAGFKPNLVSNADEAGIIHKNIIQNLYENPIVICDVSGKNPNVMFELGMRLAFDKPTIIIKDDKTTYSFDTSSIEHIEYPRDLRFTKILAFKAKLTTKIKSTLEKSNGDPEYSSFLKHFGQFKVAKIEKTEVTGLEYVLSEISSLRQEIKTATKNTRYFESSAHGKQMPPPPPPPLVLIKLKIDLEKADNETIAKILKLHRIIEWRIEETDGTAILNIKCLGNRTETINTIVTDLHNAGIASEVLLT